MCFTCSARTEDEPMVGPRPVTYTVTPVTVHRSSPVVEMAVAPLIQTVRPSTSRSPRASRTSQNSQSRPSPRHSGASIPLRPLSSHTPPLTPLSTHHAAGPDLPYSLHRRRFSAVVVIEHQSVEPRIISARPSSKPTSLRSRDSPRTSDRNIGSPVTVTSPGSGRDVGRGAASPSRRPSQPHMVRVTDDNDAGDTPIRIVRYRSGSGRHRRYSGTSPRGSGSSLRRGGSGTPRGSGNVDVGSPTSLGSPLHHAATTPASGSGSGSATRRGFPASVEDDVDADSTQRIVTSPAALTAGAHATVSVLSQQRLANEDTRSMRAEAGSARGDEVLGSEAGGATTTAATAAPTRVHWDDRERLRRRRTADGPPMPAPSDRDRLDPNYQARRRSSGTVVSGGGSGSGSGSGNGSGSGGTASAAASAGVPLVAADEALGPRSSAVSVRSTRSARERVVIVDPVTGRSTREYRR